MSSKSEGRPSSSWPDLDEEGKASAGLAGAPDVDGAAEVEGADEEGAAGGLDWEEEEGLNWSRTSEGRDEGRRRRQERRSE